VEFAVSTLATVVEKNLPDFPAATQELQIEPVLLILDNLESLEAQPLRELLGVAKEWSEAGESRVLITTRIAKLEYPDYCYLPLKGLDREDALDYFQALAKLPPKPKIPLPGRETLLDLFKQVDFHPLSIGLLAQQLKFRAIEELGERLRKLLQDKPGNVLLASLNLSLERLSPEARRWLPRLGVFQGGALESQLLEITELAESDWAGLRQELAATGLIQVEHLLGVNSPFLKFHPALAPVLWPAGRPQLYETFSASRPQGSL